MRKAGAWLAVAAGTLLASPSWAQFAFPVPSPAELEAAKTYAAPKISEAEARKLMLQPDLQGHWVRTGYGFDPLNYKEAFEVTFGANFSASAGSRLTAVPYKPEYQKKYEEAIADAVAGKDRDTFALCKPYGMPRFMNSSSGFDVMQGAELIVLHDAYDNETRRIFLDGRPHTSPVGAQDSDARTYTGHSVGHWEGDTLVVDTVNIVDGVYDNTLAPHSDQIRVGERFRRAGADLLEVKMVIEDPVMFTRPWNVTRYYRQVRTSALQNQPGTPTDPKDRKYKYHNLLDAPCETTIDMSKGYQSLILPQEIEAQQSSPAK